MDEAKGMDAWWGAAPLWPGVPDEERRRMSANCRCSERGRRWEGHSRYCGIGSQRMGEKNDSLRGHSEREEICMEKKIRMEREK